MSSTSNSRYECSSWSRGEVEEKADIRTLIPHTGIISCDKVQNVVNCKLREHETSRYLIEPTRVNQEPAG